MDIRDFFLKHTLTLSRFTFASGIFPMSMGRFFLDSAASTFALPPDTYMGLVDAYDLTLYEIKKENADRKGAVLYLPGGGYHLCSVQTHKRLASNLSDRTGQKVFVLEYRKAPEFKFPAPVEDARRAYVWLLDNGYKPSEISIGGDSAGGGLTLALLLELKNKGIELPSCAFALSPWTDLSCSGASMELNAHLDPWLSVGAARDWSASYLGGANQQNPLASPLFGDLRGLPPLLIHVGSHEILFDDSIRFYKKAKQAGVVANCKIWDDMIHVFQVFDRVYPEALQAITEIGIFIKENQKVHHK